MKYVTCSTSSKVLDVLRAKGLDTGKTRAAHSAIFEVEIDVKIEITMT